MLRIYTVCNNEATGGHRGGHSKCTKKHKQEETMAYYIHGVIIISTLLLTVNTLLLAWNSVLQKTKESTESSEFHSVERFGEDVSYVVAGVNIGERYVAGLDPFP